VAGSEDVRVIGDDIEAAEDLERIWLFRYVSNLLISTGGLIAVSLSIAESSFRRPTSLV
jgi:hypothetical protein